MFSLINTKVSYCLENRGLNKLTRSPTSTLSNFSFKTFLIIIIIYLLLRQRQHIKWVHPILKSRYWFKPLDRLRLAFSQMPSPSQQSAVTLTFDFRNLISWPIGRGYIPCKFHWDCSSRSWDIVATGSVWTKERTDNGLRRQSGIKGMKKFLMTVRYRVEIVDGLATYRKSETGGVLSKKLWAAEGCVLVVLAGRCRSYHQLGRSRCIGRHPGSHAADGRTHLSRGRWTAGRLQLWSHLHSNMYLLTYLLTTQRHMLLLGSSPSPSLKLLMTTNSLALEHPYSSYPNISRVITIVTTMTTARM